MACNLVIFPADPRLPGPDWPRLRDGLVACGFMVEPRGDAISGEALEALWEAAMTVLPAARRRPPPVALRCPRQLWQGLEGLGVVPFWAPPDWAAISICDLVAALADHGAVASGLGFAPSEEYRPGPLYDTLCATKRADPATRIEFADHGERIVVDFGANLADPPRIPGTGRVVEDWDEFLGPWVEDPGRQWIDPATGCGYDLLELDFGHGLAAYRCALEIAAPRLPDGARAAALVSDVAGRAFRFAVIHRSFRAAAG